MREFYYFVKNLFRLLIFVRGVLVILFAIVLFCAVLLTFWENLTFGHSLYLSAMTALTVGYGDIAPKTTVGRAVCVVIGFLGVVFTGLIIAVATRALAHAVEDERRHRTAKQGAQMHKQGSPEHGKNMPHP